MLDPLAAFAEVRPDGCSRRTLLLGAVTALLAAGEGHPSEPSASAVAGFLESVRGPASLSSGGTTTALDPRRDIARPLLSGDVIQCPTGSIVVVRLEAGVRSVRGPARFAVPQAPGEDEGPVLQAIRHLLRPGVPAAASRGPLYCPSPGGAVRVASAAFRWQACPGVVLLRLRTAGGKELWRAEAPGKAGTVDPESPRESLRKFRESLGQGAITLTLAAAERPDTPLGAVEFTILTELAERSLHQELTRWGKEPADAPLRYIGRARAFGMRLLLNEEAEELELARQAFPESRTFLRALIAAHRRTGNILRQQELERLPPDLK